MTVRRVVSAIAICAVAGTAPLAFRASDFRPQTSERPRLVVLIVIDQMRADYFQRYADRFTDGFKRLWDQGAVFTEARYTYATTKTAQGHAQMVSGFPPAATGIVGDRWYDRQAGAIVEAGVSHAHKLLGSSGEGGSPEHLAVPTVGDALKEARPGSIVLAASWKRYSAVLNGGRHPDAAYWFDETTGHFVTSDYYARTYPEWAAAFTRADLTTPFFGTTWQTHPLGNDTLPDAAYRRAVRYTPHGNAILLAFAKGLVEQSGVGTDAIPDLVTISFSCVDYIGHEYGPGSTEFDDALVRLDKDVGDLLRALDAKVGAGNYSIAFTADHGVAFVPEKEKARGVDAGRLHALQFRSAIDTAVAAKLRVRGPVVAAFQPPDLYLRYQETAAQGVAREAVDRAVVEFVEAQPGVAKAYTAADLAKAGNPADPYFGAVVDSYYPDRSGDIYVLVKPNYVFWSGPGTTHGTPYDYDARVPLIFLGAGVKPGRYDQRIRVNELAPTLGHLLGVPFKGDAKGRVLLEALQP